MLVLGWAWGWTSVRESSASVVALLVVASKAVVASVWVAAVVASVAAVVFVVASVWARVVVALVAVVLLVSVFVLLLVVSVLFVLVLFVVLLVLSTMKRRSLAAWSVAAQALASWLCRRALWRRVVPSRRAVSSVCPPIRICTRYLK